MMRQKTHPYKDLYMVDRMNASSHYNNLNGLDNFSVTMDWKTEDENIDYAEFSDYYYLEYSFELDLGE